MRRGAKPSKAKAKRNVARRSPENEGTRVRDDLEKRLAEALGQLQTRDRELVEALEQQTATSEILRVISSSPTDAQPVFDTIVRNSDRLLGGLAGSLALRVGDEVHLVALTPTNPEGDAVLRRLYPTPIGADGGHAEIVRLCRPLMITDTEAELTGRTREFARIRGFRSRLSVPLIRDGIAIGSLGVTRPTPGAFTDREIALLQTFADQAVIAIENVRLFKELGARNRDLTESLEQQRATSEILRVISTSPANVQPVFEAIVRASSRLCDSPRSNLMLIVGDHIELAARCIDGAVKDIRDLSDPFHRAYPMPIEQSGLAGIVVREGRTFVTDDAQHDPRFSPARRAAATEAGFHSLVGVPMMRGGQVIGALNVARTEIRPYTAGEIQLLQTFADQAVIAIANVRLFNETKDALDRQTATADILRVISSSPTDVQPTFDAIAASATRLCEAVNGLVMRYDGQSVDLVAHHNVVPERLAAIRQIYPMTPDRRGVTGRVVLTRDVVHLPDVAADPEYALPAATTIGYRSVLGVPMLRDGAAIGVILVARDHVAPFSDKHIDLLKTFADQAVIAIENVRLFTELQTSNRELTTALDTQTATSDILRVISHSPTDVQPVFEAILSSAIRLLGAYSGTLTRIAGEQIEIAAISSTSDVGDAALRARFPQPLTSGGPHARTIRDRAPLNIADAHTDPRLPEGFHAYARVRGYRSQVAVPLLHHDEAIGTISVTRGEPGGFTVEEISLLQTFADQAVIAIENVRLFTELQQKNTALTEAHAQVTEALEQQTATSEVLKVISRSAFDLHPVLETLIENAVRLCSADKGFIYRQDGEVYRVATSYGHSPEFLAVVEGNPIPQNRASATGRAVLDRRVVHIHDILDDPEYTWAEQHRGAEEMHRTILAVPMLRERAVIGVIVIRRTRVDPFTDKQIELVTTFADQAVIAIENVRLFKELEARTHDLTRSVGELRALGEIGQAITSTLDLQTVLRTIVARATQLSGTDAGVIYEYEEQREVFLPRATEHLEAEIVETMLTTPVRKGEGATGRLADVPEPIQVPDISDAPAESRVRGALVRAGYRALLAVPLVREDRVLGGLTVIRKTTGQFDAEIIDLMRTFATQSALAIQNARLFLEIADKSRQLELASQHKSEFLANMSHELRTPLNAIIGFSEVLSERMFGELNDKQEEYLKDIHASGQHLLSLINDILDLSKIEAGRMELELSDFNLPAALDSALTLVRERAGRHGIALQMIIDDRLGQVRADERKIRQVVLNLLSNAIKFTPEGGRIEVRAAPADGAVEVAVTDTGVGIAPEDQEAIFEEFRQVGTAAKKVEGTGLGLALSRKFVELHGGRIWVESQVGVGSTFTFSIPVHHGS